MPAELQEELVWVLQPRQYAYVRQQNQLVEARYSLTARELKLVLCKYSVKTLRLSV